MATKKRALITGITGQDGSYLADLLLEKGYQVHGLIRRNSNFEIIPNIQHIRDRVTLHYGDLTDSANLRNVISKVKPDEIYNLAAMSHVHVSFEVPEFTGEVNGLGVLNLLEAIREYQGENNNVRFYQASTSEMFGKVQEVPQKETTPFYPRSPYGVAKLYGHWITVNYREAYGIYACNGILFNHESKRRGETFVTRKVTRGLANIAQGLEKCLFMGNIDALRDWGHAKDYVRMQWLMLQQEKPDDFICATGISHSVRELCEYVFSCLGLDWKKYVTQDEKFLRPEELHDLKGDSKKLRTITGWKPKYTFESMLDEMINYWIDKL